MSLQKLVVPGFGVGSFYGTPITTGLAPTSTITLTGTQYPAAAYMVTGLVTGTNVSLNSTTNGVTGTWVVLSGAPGLFQHDGASAKLINTTTSITVVFIQV